jgi:hypothetical protein
VLTLNPLSFVSYFSSMLNIPHSITNFYFILICMCLSFVLIFFGFAFFFFSFVITWLDFQEKTKKTDVLLRTFTCKSENSPGKISPFKNFGYIFLQFMLKWIVYFPQMPSLQIYIILYLSFSL